MELYAGMAEYKSSGHMASDRFWAHLYDREMNRATSNLEDHILAMFMNGSC